MRKKKQKQRDTRAFPVPEAIDGVPWSVQEVPARQAGVAAAHHEMVVPLGNTPAERMVRMHEMTHVKITPSPDMEIACQEIHDQIVQNCEDARVHGQMNRLDFPIGEMEGILSEMELKYMSADQHLAELAAAGAALNNTGEWYRLSHLIDALDPPQPERRAAFDFGTKLADNRMFYPSDLPEFEVTKQMAREIIDVFGDPREPEPPPLPIPIERLESLADADPFIQVHGDYFGQMILEEPPLPLRLPGHLKGHRKKLPDIRGRRLHRVGRLHTDGRVFANIHRKKGGGAVLIDTSGSMSLTSEEVLQLCLTYPAGVIGAYSGSGSDFGTLRVIARNGRRVPDDEIDPPGGGNVVDGPALDWLALQPGPRWWISDAGVSGGANGLKYCLDVCRRNNITRVDNAWEIVGRNV